jgi:hypothetical protein
VGYNFETFVELALLLAAMRRTSRGTFSPAPLLVNHVEVDPLYELKLSNRFKFI